MFPHERSLVQKFAGKPFALLGVNSDKNLEDIKPKLVADGVTWRSFWCGEKGTRGPIPSSWNVHAWPTLFVIDHEGVIQKRWVGSPSRAEDIDDFLEAHIARATKAAESGGK